MPKRVIYWTTYRTGIRLLISLLLIVLIAAVIYHQVQTRNTGQTVEMPLSGKIVTIDPGHGGPDGGAVSKDGTIEKDINLSIALLLRDFLQESGALVFMTREIDTDLARPESRRRKTEDLHRRAELVKEHQSDLLISIHMNAIASSRWSGAQTFYDSRSHEDSVTLAKLIQNELVMNLENTTREAKNISSVYLLKTATIPSALIEVGFLSNPEEARLLADEAYQHKVAASIYRGMLRYASGEGLD